MKGVTSLGGLSWRRAPDRNILYPSQAPTVFGGWSSAWVGSMRKGGWHFSKVSSRRYPLLRLIMTSYSARATHLLCERRSLVDTPADNSKHPSVNIHSVALQVFYPLTRRISPFDRSYPFAVGPCADPVDRPVIFTEIPILHWPIRCTLANSPRRRRVERRLSPPTPSNPDHLGYRSQTTRFPDTSTIYRHQYTGPPWQH